MESLMPTYRGKPYQLNPTCLLCGQLTEERHRLRTGTQRNVLHAEERNILVTVHKSCQTRRTLLAFGGIFLSLLIGVGLIPWLISHFIGGLIALIMVLVGIFLIPWTAFYFSMRWLIAPVRHFLLEQGLEIDPIT